MASAEDTICLVAEDSDEDYESLRRAFLRRDADVPLRRCVDGDELLDYLGARGVYADEPRPALVVLDLDLPGTDGREVLEIVAADPTLRPLPLIVFTTSSSEADGALAYGSGANSFLVKPTAYEDFDRIVDSVTAFWFGQARLPGWPRGAVE